jgi:hypothetical protein
MTGELSEKLIPQLRAHFPHRGLIVSDGKQPVAVFPAVHAEVGDIRICDDDWELTLYIGKVHGHFSCYDNDLTPDGRAQTIVEDVLTFLGEVFAEQIEFWVEGDRMGGWHQRGKANPFGRSNIRRYVWSGPLTEPS